MWNVGCQVKNEEKNRFFTRSFLRCVFELKMGPDKNLYLVGEGGRV